MTASPSPSAPKIGVVAPSAVLSLALFGDSLLYVVLPVYAPAFGISFAWVGLLLAANRLIRIAAYGAVAELGRRIGPRRLTIAAAVGGTMSTAAYGLTTGEAALLGARMLWGLSFAALNLTTLAYALSSERHAGRRVGTLHAVAGIGPILSLTLGAGLIAPLGPQTVFLLLAAATLPSVALAWRLPELPGEAEPRPRSLLPRPSRLDLWAFALALAVDGIFVMTLSVLLAGLTSVQSAVLASGLFLAARRVIEVVLAPAGGAIGDRFGAGRMILVFGTMSAAGLGLIAGGFVHAGAALVVVAHAVLATLGPVLAAERGAGGRMAALSVYATWRDIGAAIGPLIAGALVERVALPALYGAAAALVVIALLLNLPGMSRGRHGRS